MKAEYKIVIPSRERASWMLLRGSRVTLPAIAHLKPTMRVREDDSQIMLYRSYCEQYDCNMEVYDARKMPFSLQNYDAMINAAVRTGPDVLMMIDDDLTFNMQNPIPDAKPMFCKPSREVLTELIQQAANIVGPEMPMMSFTPILTRSQTHLIALCKPMMMAYICYVPHFRAHPEHRFWISEDIVARCELVLSLRLLTQGFLTCFMCTVFIPDNVNNPGGASVYRNYEREKRGVAYLKDQFPELVRLRDKRGWVGDPTIIRKAPVVSWRRAFNKDSFRERFGRSAENFAREVRERHEKEYFALVESIRAKHRG